MQPRVTPQSQQIVKEVYILLGMKSRLDKKIMIYLCFQLLRCFFCSNSLHSHKSEKQIYFIANLARLYQSSISETEKSTVLKFCRIHFELHAVNSDHTTPNTSIQQKNSTQHPFQPKILIPASPDEKKFTGEKVTKVPVKNMR